MQNYADNIKFLRWFAPFRTMAISFAFIAPFFAAHGLSMTEIMVLQSAFSLFYLLWEVPSGYIADRIGYARSIKISAPIAALGYIFYGMSSEVWQFAIGELLLAISSGLVSGADRSLVYASLKAEGCADETGRQMQSIRSYGFIAGAALGIGSIAIEHYFGLAATLIADGLLIAIGMPLTWQLKEAPNELLKSGKATSAWQSMLHMGRDRQSCWLIVLTVALGTATYMSTWLSMPYLQGLGVPLWLFPIIVAGRSLCRGLLSKRFHPRFTQRAMIGYVMLVLIGAAAMVVANPWLALLLLAHDIVYATHMAPIEQRLNDRMIPGYRATLNSVVNLMGRLSFMLLGPVIGIIADASGHATALFAACAGCSVVAAVAVWQLRRHKAFEQRG